jgi:hypothetical protein
MRSDLDIIAAQEARQAAIHREIVSLRMAVFEAAESGDQQAALRACKAIVAVLEKHTEMQLIAPAGEVGLYILPADARQLMSRYSSSCKQCEAPIKKGELIWWSRAEGAVCLRCGGIRG